MRISAVVAVTFTLVALSAGLPGCRSKGGDAAMNSADGAHEAAKDEEDEQELDVRDVVGEAKVSLATAIGAALAARPGTAIEAELEGELEDGKRQVFFEVMIVAPGGIVYEVTLDPATGAVKNVVVEEDAKEAAEIRAAAAALPPHAKSLGDLVALAEASTGAHAVEAKIEAEKGGAECEVELLKGREKIDAEVGIADGKVRAEAGEEDENDGDDDDEKGGEEKGEHEGHQGR